MRPQMSPPHFFLSHFFFFSFCYKHIYTHSLHHDDVHVVVIVFHLRCIRHSWLCVVYVEKSLFFSSVVYSLPFPFFFFAYTTLLIIFALRQRRSIENYSQNICTFKGYPISFFLFLLRRIISIRLHK